MDVSRRVGLFERRECRVALVEAEVDERPRFYVKDPEGGQLTCVSRGANGSSYSAAIDGNGTQVTYVTDATNLGYQDRNRAGDVVVQDLRTGKVELVSRAALGVAANAPSWRPVIASSGRAIAFVSSASDLICRHRCARRDLDQNLVPDVYLFDAISGNVRRVSVDDTGEWWAASRGPALDNDARVVAFSSSQPTSVHDQSGDEDLFILSLDRSQAEHNDSRKPHRYASELRHDAFTERDGSLFISGREF